MIDRQREKVYSLVTPAIYPLLRYTPLNHTTTSDVELSSPLSPLRRSKQQTPPRSRHRPQHIFQRPLQIEPEGSKIKIKAYYFQSPDHSVQNKKDTMQSTTSQTSIPDRSRDSRVRPDETMTAIPSTQTTTPSSQSQHRGSASDEPWKPSFDRRQSWSIEDRKHQAQERLMDVVLGQESGFTETGRGG